MAKAVIGSKNGNSRAERKEEGCMIDCKENECLGDLLNRYNLYINEKGNEKRETKREKEEKVGERKNMARRKLRNCKLTTRLACNDCFAILCKTYIYSLFL